MSTRKGPPVAPPICSFTPGNTIRPKAVDVSSFPKGQRSDIFVPISHDGIGVPVYIPIIVARGLHRGPVVGITAAIHGNELNGVRIIQEVLEQIDLEQLKGTLLCAPVVNIPAYNTGQRYYSDGMDLNTVFPGKKDGRPAEQYALAFSKTFLPACDYLLDLHTASEGRLNTYYIRVDFEDEKASELAHVVNPQILLHTKGGDGTFRAAARRAGVPGITIEAGNPNVLQEGMISNGINGVFNVLRHLHMYPGEAVRHHTPVICNSSKWLRTTCGGILEVTVDLLEIVRKKQLIAEVRDPFGNIVERYYAPRAGVVIGRAAHPVAIPGTRFCHLGKIDDQ